MHTAASVLLAVTALLGQDASQKDIPPIEECEQIHIIFSTPAWMLHIRPDGSGDLIYGSIDAGTVKKGTFNFQRIYKRVAKTAISRAEAKKINDRRQERGEKRQHMAVFRFVPKQRDETSKKSLYIDDKAFVGKLFDDARKNLTRDWQFDFLFLLYPPTKNADEWSRPLWSHRSKDHPPKAEEFRQLGIYTQEGWRIEIRRNGSGVLAYGRRFDQLGFEATFPKQTFDFDKTFERLLKPIKEPSRQIARNEKIPSWTYHNAVGVKRPKDRMRFAFYCPDRVVLREIFDQGKKGATLVPGTPGRSFDKLWDRHHPVRIPKVKGDEANGPARK